MRQSRTKKPAARKSAARKPAVKKSAGKKTGSSVFGGVIREDSKQQWWLSKGITPIGLVLWPSLFATKLSYSGRVKQNKGKQTDETDREYSLTLLFRKSDPRLKSMETKIMELLKKAAPKKRAVWSKSPVKDGDDKFRENKDQNSDYQGTKYIIVTRPGDLEPPEILNEKNEPMLNKAEFYAGCYAQASIDFKVYNNEFGMGVTAYWSGTKKVADGDAIGFSRSDAVQSAFSQESASVGKDGKVKY